MVLIIRLIREFVPYSYCKGVPYDAVAVLRHVLCTTVQCVGSAVSF